MDYIRAVSYTHLPPEGLPTSDEAADFYLYAVEQLEHHGYRQYEISNFAKPGYEGRHNLCLLYTSQRTAAFGLFHCRLCSQEDHQTFRLRVFFP